MNKENELICQAEAALRRRLEAQILQDQLDGYFDDDTGDELDEDEIYRALYPKPKRRPKK